ncbi:MAG: hypothetical protein Tsb0013_16890 [Phycisphaerales bacterium]
MNEDHPQQTPPPVAPAPGPGGPVDEEAQSKKILAGVLAIVLGSLGIHKFVLGYTTSGIIMLVCSLLGYATSFLCIPAFLPFAMWVIGIIEGIVYLTKPNAEFRRIYMDGKKEWF